MTVPLLHYRPWRGQFKQPAASIWPLARVALQTVLRRKLFWWIYALGLMIFCAFFFGQYVLSWAENQVTENSVPVLGVRQNPQRLVHVLGEVLKLNGRDVTYANYIWYQGYTVMAVLALTGSLLIGNDIHHGSLPFYLSKPLSRWHYMTGKCLAAGVFINLLTTIPALVLFVEYALLEPQEFESRAYLLPGILGYGLVITVCLSLLLVATASWVRRTVPMIMVWATLFVFCRGLGDALVDRLGLNVHWRLFDLWHDCYLVGCHCLGLRLTSPQPAWWKAGLVLGVVCLLCLTYLIRRIRAVEIVR
jgi:ABC-type transport system involved in multi-copper enzyme maturation permease subunit